MLHEDDSKATLRQVEERSALHFHVHVMSSSGRLITDQFAGSDLIQIGALFLFFFHFSAFCIFLFVFLGKQKANIAPLCQCKLEQSCACD